MANYTDDEMYTLYEMKEAALAAYDLARYGKEPREVAESLSHVKMHVEDAIFGMRIRRLNLSGK